MFSVVSLTKITDHYHLSLIDGDAFFKMDDDTGDDPFQPIAVDADGNVENPGDTHDDDDDGDLTGLRPGDVIGDNDKW